jgi:hypothetical protein
MARKKSSHHAKRKVRVRKNAAEAAPAKRAIANPPMGTDIVQFILPGFAAYAGTRFLNRIVFTQMNKRWPKYSKHAAALSSVASFLAVWLLGHKIKRIEKYHTPIVVGAAIASMQTLVQTYLPKYGWIVSDVSAAQYKNGSKQLPAPATAALSEYNPLEPIELEDDSSDEPEAQGDDSGGDDALMEGLGSLEPPAEFSAEAN